MPPGKRPFQGLWTGRNNKGARRSVLNIIDKLSIFKMNRIKIDDFKTKGYAFIRKFYSENEIAILKDEFEKVKNEGLKHDFSFRHQNLLYIIQKDPNIGKVLRFCHWPSYSNNVLDSFRTNQRMLELLEPLLGGNLKSTTNQVIWKTPGAANSSYGLHQDSRFRRPVSAFRNMMSSGIQTSLAIDSHTHDNGCLKLIEGSHIYGEMNYFTDKSIFDEKFSKVALEKLGLKNNKIISVELEPGDLIVWHPYLFHGSGSNYSTNDRRSYTNAYMKSDDCDRGEWAFRGGKSVLLKEPVLVQYDDLYSKPQPHYISGPPNPYNI